MAAFVFGFILTFRQWGDKEFSFKTGFTNFISAIIIIFISMYLYVSAQKLTAIYLGYTVKYEVWINGLLIGLLIAFMSYGWIPVLFTGTLLLIHSERLRLGKHRYGLNIRDQAVVSIAGPCLNLLIILIFVPILISNPELIIVKSIIKFNFIFAFFSLLPIPTIKGTKLGNGGTPGFNILFYAKGLFVFSVLVFIVYFLLMQISIQSKLLIPWIFAFIISGLLTYVFFKALNLIE